jgi:hypothetical protein
MGYLPPPPLGGVERYCSTSDEPASRRQGETSFDESGSRRPMNATTWKKLSEMMNKP